MSKLELIKKSLESNPKIVIVNTKENTYLPETRGEYSQTVDFWVAPKVKLFSHYDLQPFMIFLVPEIKWSSLDPFMHRKMDDLFLFGRLHYDEKIGEEKTLTKRMISLSEDMGVEGFVDGKRTIETETVHDLIRRTTVRLYPNEKLAREVLAGKLDAEFYMNFRSLQNYCF